ncbi:hypothetical protein C8R47DRAFT_662403 [Mycena vitilis]|nr:hypothetical protein C8R47DRAFT_662403 [Mycena vitilis]
MDSLPPELLAEVFTRALLWDLVPRPASATEIPLVLTLVSKRWRTVALETPVLWCSLSYYIQHDGEAGRNALDGVRAWLERSGSVPLYLVISIGTFDAEVANAFLRIYYAQRHRWRVLELFMAGGAEDGLLPLPCDGLDKLEEIDSQLGDNGRIQWSLPLYTAALPALRSLTHRETVAGTLVLPDLSAHWPQLVHLDIARNVLPCHSIDVLRRCSNLETCRIYFRPGPERPPPTSRAPCTLPKLHSLWIRSKFANGEDVFEALTLPALRALEIVGAWWPQPSFVPFLLRSTCPVRALSLPGTNILEDELIGILSVVGGTLETLELGVQYPDGRMCATGKIIGLLNADSMGRDVLLPNATGIHFRSQGVLDWADGEFAGMVESRWRTSATGERNAVRIEDITLTGAIALGKEHEDDVRRLGKMGEQGLKVHTCIACLVSILRADVPFGRTLPDI